MTNPIKVPGSTGTPKYIEGIRVTYKATSGIFNYYDGERRDVESITGVVVGWGFQFDTQKGKPSKKKSASLVSAEFGFGIMQSNSPIKMRELVRENGEFESKPAGAKSYKSWKEEGQRLTKIVYILDAQDTNKLYKIQFSGLSFGEINKYLKDDLPNYIVTIKASSETKSTDNGDFYMPILEKKADIGNNIYDTVCEKVTFVYNILNEASDAEGFEVSNEIQEMGITAEEVFGVDDIP